MSLAILHLQPTTPRSLPVVSTHSYQRQHQLKYLIWPIPDRKAPPWNLIQVRQMLEEHQKKKGGGGELSATSPSQNSVLSRKPFFAVCVEKAQTKQLREGGREGDSQTTKCSVSKAASMDHAVEV